MKKSILVLTTTFLIHGLAVAASLPFQGVLEGDCQVDVVGGVRLFPFSVGPNEKVALGYLGQDGGNYKVEIVNNTDEDLARSFGALSIGFSRDQGALKNPPELCPLPTRGNEILAEECRLRNESLKHKPMARDDFKQITNSGYVDNEWLFAEGGRSETREMIKAKNVYDGVPVAIGSDFQLGGTKVICSGSFRQMN